MTDPSDLQAQMDRAQAAEARVHELQTANLALAERVDTMRAERAVLKSQLTMAEHQRDDETNACAMWRQKHEKATADLATVRQSYTRVLDASNVRIAKFDKLALRLGRAELALRDIIKACDEDSGYPNGWSGFVIGAEHVKSLAERGLAKEDE